MLFNPIRSREVAPGSIARVLRADFKNGDPLGNFAKSDLSDVVHLWLVGMSREIAPAIPRSIEWLDKAIAEDEASWFDECPNFHRMNLYWAKALGLWLRDGVNATDAWEQARQFNAAALLDSWPVMGLMPGVYDKVGTVWAKGHIPTSRLDDYMAFCYQAEQYEIGIAEYEQYHGDKAFSLKKIRTPKELGYALCLHKARGQFERAELLTAGRKILHAKLQDTWLGYGQDIRAATWLKIVYEFHEPALTPLQTVLRAYDDMPDVPRPEFV